MKKSFTTNELTSKKKSKTDSTTKITVIRSPNKNKTHKIPYRMTIFSSQVNVCLNQISNCTISHTGFVNEEKEKRKSIIS
jgi:hypothetical protein